MLAALLEARQKMAIREAPDPPLAPGCIAVAPKAIGICGTDIHAYLGTMEHRVPYPAILGHELAGVVAEVAPGVSGFAPGDPVAVDNVWACGHCPRCAEGQLNVCENLKVVGIDCPRALALLEAGHLHPDKLITHRVPLAAAPQAFADLAARKPGMIKAVVELP